jgi:small subunit ribosomal protein S18
MKPTTAQEYQRANLSRDLTKQIPRRWKAGDIYGPSDLTPYEMMKWKRRKSPNCDFFDLLDLDPLQEYKVFPLD